MWSRQSDIRRLFQSPVTPNMKTHETRCPSGHGTCCNLRVRGLCSPRGEARSLLSREGGRRRRRDRLRPYSISTGHATRAEHGTVYSDRLLHDSARKGRLAFFFSAGGPGIDSDPATGSSALRTEGSPASGTTARRAAARIAPNAFRQHDCRPPSTTQSIDPTAFCAGSTQ
jgi:hypothetical protein